MKLTLSRMYNLTLIIVATTIFYVFDKECRANIKEYGYWKAIEHVYFDFDKHGRL